MNATIKIKEKFWEHQRDMAKMLGEIKKLSGVSSVNYDQNGEVLGIIGSEFRTFNPVEVYGILNQSGYNIIYSKLDRRQEHESN